VDKKIKNDSAYDEIYNSKYFDSYPGDDLNTAFEVLYGDGISNYWDNFPFTHEQAFEIRKILERKFNSQEIIRFILKLRFILEGAVCLLNQPDYKTYKNDRKSMLAVLEKSSGLLDAIRQGHGIYRISNFSSLLEDKHGEIGLECQDLAVTVGNLLSILIRKIKSFDELNERRIKGRPTADNKGIIAEIASIWEECFKKKPTKTTGGPFEAIVGKVLECLNLPYVCPQRKIKEALKKKKQN